MNDPIRSMLDGVLQSSLRATGATFGNVQIMNWQTGVLEIVSQFGFDREFLQYFKWVRPSDGTACGRAARIRREVIIVDLEQNKEFPRPALMMILDSGVRAVHSMPLISTRGAFVGMLSTHFQAVHQASTEEINEVKLLAHKAANDIIKERTKGVDVRTVLATSQEAIATSRDLLRRTDERWRRQLM